MGILGKTAVSALAICVASYVAGAQSAQSSACAIDPPSFTTNAPNIFNDRQEQDLGDAWAEEIEPDLRLAAPAADDELTRIGERLLATLPPTEIHYRFRIYDSGEINAFSIAGGRVYVSRKLIAAVKNEDELAGVIAHEIGHISTHQFAITFTRAFRIRLGVTQVGDRADIFAKVHQFESTPEKSAEGEGGEGKDELVADHVALYAMMRAGYAAESFPTLFNQISMNQGKTGSWLSDLFGLTHEDTKRYRATLKLIDTLPAGCKGKAPGQSDAFQAWLNSTVEERAKTVAEGASGDQPLKLDPPLRPGLWRILFSPNGKFVLAQDEGSIAVIQVVPAQVLFRIDAPNVEGAQFTPDSESVVFSDSDLRVERWSVATGKRTEVKELVVFEGCNQSMLMPDGKTLVCITLDMQSGMPRFGLKLIDVESGNAFFEKLNFYQTSALSPMYSLFRFAVEIMEGEQFANIQISPEGRYLLVIVDNRVLAYDMERRQPVELGGKLKGLSQTRLCFLGSDQIYVVDPHPAKGLFPARILSFPDGRVLKETQIGDQTVRAASKGPLLIAGPLKDFAIGVLDPMDGKVLAGWKFPTVDVWENKVAAEDSTGRLFVGEFSSHDSTEITLPLGPLPSPRAAQFSPDGKFLVVSVKSRAEAWDLTTGKQVRLMRPIRSLWVDGNDRIFGQFPQYLDHDPAEVEMALTETDVKNLGKYEDTDWQYHDMQLRFKSRDNDKRTDINVMLEARKMGTPAVAWSREFRYEKPACWPAEDNRLVLAWDLTDVAARDEIRKYPQLKQEAEAQKNHKRGLLIETVVPETGAALEQVVLPEVDLTRGWNDERFARVSGGFVLVRGEHSNTVIYRLDSGAKVGEFFGFPVATNAAAGVIAAVNREDEILLVEEQTGKELKRFTLGSPVLLARIVGGKTLLVLTADQVVHRMPLPK